MKVSDFFVQALESEGVEYIFGLPGEENLDILESIRKSKKIKFILTRHEQSAGFMAAIFGRLTGKAGVCLSTLGPGATNLVTASAYAKLGAMPMIMITGQKPIRKNNQGKFQIIDIVKIMKPVTKYAKQISSGQRISSIIRNSFKIAEEERPGPVLLELPEDIAQEEVENVKIIKPSYVRRPIAEEKAIKIAVEMIEKAKRPIILAGAGINRKQISKMLILFLEKTKILYITTQMGKGATPPNPYYIGTTALSKNSYVHNAIKYSDLVINIGHDVVEKPPFLMRHGKEKVIHINFFSARFDDVYFPQLEVVGDIANSIYQIKEKIKVQKHWDFSKYKKIQKKIRETIEISNKENDFPMKPARIVKDINDIYFENGVVCLDNGLYKIWFARNYKTKESNTLILDNALATMGAGLPSAIATKIIKPEKKVVAVAGDGGFMMNSQEIETAIRLKLDIVIIVLSDNAFGMIKWKQKIHEHDEWGLDFKNPDFIKYAESYGAKGYKIKKTEDFKKILFECSEKKGVHLIDLPIDYNTSQENF